MIKGDIMGVNCSREKQKKGNCAELFQEFYLNIQIRGRAEDTLRTYKYHHGYFMKFTGENAFCDEINLETFIGGSKRKKRYK